MVHPTSLHSARLSSARSAGRACLAIGLLTSLATAQGETGFLRGKGNTDFVLSYTLDQYDQFWVGNNKVSMPGVGTVQRHTGTLYTAYGATDQIDLILNASYVVAESDGTGNFPTESDPQDLALAAKYRIYDHMLSDNVEFSVGLLPGVKVPMSKYQNNSVTAIGDRNVDLRARFVAQLRTLTGYYFALESGYDFRLGDPPDEVPLNLTLGGTLANRLTLSPFLSLVDSLWGTDIPAPFPTNQESYLRAGLGAYYRFNDQWGATASFRTTLVGKNTGDVDGFSVGVVFKLH